MKTENFALTGTFGYRGSLDMLKRVRNENLKTVFIFQTADMMQREPAKPYAPKKIFQFGDFEGLDVDIFDLVTLEVFIKDLKKYARGKRPEQEDIVNDYIKQGEPSDTNVHQTYEGFKSEDIKPLKRAEFSKLQAYCAQEGLKCIYVYGPLIQPVCDKSGDYYQAVNAIIEEEGMTLAYPQPLCIPLDKLGDSSDHVRPDFKKEYTERYYRVLKDFLP